MHILLFSNSIIHTWKSLLKKKKKKVWLIPEFEHQQVTQVKNMQLE